MPADVLAGIGGFTGSRRISLRFNRLTDLPDDLFTLPAVEQIDLYGNQLSDPVERRLAAAFPQARIAFEL